MTEKRKVPRIQPYVAPCRILHGSRRFSAYLVDLSPLGARVSCAAEPPVPGDTVVLEVRFGRNVSWSRLPVEVKWASPAGEPGEAHVFGLTFARISTEEQRVLDSVLEEFRRRAALLA